VSLTEAHGLAVLVVGSLVAVVAWAYRRRELAKARNWLTAEAREDWLRRIERKRARANAQSVRRVLKAAEQRGANR
jgi:hypothetical protein